MLPHASADVVQAGNVPIYANVKAVSELVFMGQDAWELLLQCRAGSETHVKQAPARHARPQVKETTGRRVFRAHVVQTAEHVWRLLLLRWQQSLLLLPDWPAALMEFAHADPVGHGGCTAAAPDQVAWLVVCDAEALHAVGEAHTVMCVGALVRATVAASQCQATRPANAVAAPRDGWEGGEGYVRGLLLLVVGGESHHALLTVLITFILLRLHEVFQ